ncbi:hypothetical protein [Caldivirga sp. UBA161]|uniref:hypothetical protein n=1 Tax=Caldivirga sp. UBA161 TaxID=1915569 RepID=UPI0025C152D0|nr:hypothetical protein [Caldivirga sp. UBA161]
MNIRASIRVMSSLLSAGKTAEASNSDSIADVEEYKQLRSRTNEVLMMPSFNGLIVLIYDKRSGAYRLA